MSRDPSPDEDPHRPEPAPRPPSTPRRPRSERTLTASEAAGLIGVSIATVRGWADAGVIPSHRTVGGHRRFEPGELRDWLRRRGATAGARGRRAPSTDAVPACPVLARALNARVDGIVDRVLAGYEPGVGAPHRGDEGGLARGAARFVQSVAGALEAGSPGMFAGRLELTGVRASLEPDGGDGAVARHARYVVAIVAEAEALERDGEPLEEHGVACLLVVVDRAIVSLVRGIRADQGLIGG